MQKKKKVTTVCLWYLTVVEHIFLFQGLVALSTKARERTTTKTIFPLRLKKKKIPLHNT